MDSCSPEALCDFAPSPEVDPITQEPSRSEVQARSSPLVVVTNLVTTVPDDLMA